MSDQDAVAKAIASIYEAAIDPVLNSEVITALQSLLDSSAVALWDSDLLGTPTMHWTTGYDQSAVQMYVEHYHSVDPGLHDVVVATVGSWTRVKAMDAWNSTQTLNSDTREFIGDFCRPFDIRWLGGGKVIQSDSHFRYLSFRRSIGQAPFDGHDEALFRQVMPHLQRAAKIEQMLASARRRTETAEMAIGALSAAVLVVDPKLNVRLANSAAEEILRGQSVISYRDGKLRCESSVDHAHLQACVASAASGSGSGMVFSSVSPMHALQLLAIPMPSRSQSLIIGRKSDVILVVGSPGTTLHIAERLRVLFALTRAESRMAHGLAAGQSLEEIAENSGVSIATIRTHLANVLAKTGTHSQSQLVAFLRTLPAVRF